MVNIRENTIRKVTVAGAVGNLILSLFKFIAGVTGKSAAMVADAVHSLSDLVTDVVVIIMVRISSKEMDKSHDYGHGKFETLATVCVSLLLMVVGAKLMAEGIDKILFVKRGGTLEAPGLIAFYAALISIVLKELLFQWTNRVGKKVESQAMIANAWHHRSDALSSIGSAFGIAGAIFLGGKWTILDPMVACVISLVLIYVSVKIALPAVQELTEASLPDEIENHIIQIIESVPGADNAHALKTRRTGPSIVIDVHVVVDPEMTVIKAHDITTRIETAIRSEYGEGTQVTIHIEPNRDSD